VGGADESAAESMDFLDRALAGPVTGFRIGRESGFAVSTCRRSRMEALFREDTESECLWVKEWYEVDRRDLLDSRKASCSGVGLGGTGGASFGIVKNFGGGGSSSVETGEVGASSVGWEVGDGKEIVGERSGAAFLSAQSQSGERTSCDNVGDDLFEDLSEKS
jgi:hypothetical protein